MRGRSSRRDGDREVPRVIIRDTDGGGGPHSLSPARRARSAPGLPALAGAKSACRFPPLRPRRLDQHLARLALTKGGEASLSRARPALGGDHVGPSGCGRRATRGGRPRRGPGRVDVADRWSVYSRPRRRAGRGLTSNVSWLVLSRAGRSAGPTLPFGKTFHLTFRTYHPVHDEGAADRARTPRHGAPAHPARNPRGRGARGADRYVPTPSGRIEAHRPISPRSRRVPVSCCAPRDRLLRHFALVA